MAGVRSTGYYVDARKNPRKSSELQLKIYVHFGLSVLISISNISCNNNENSGRSFLWNIYMTFASWFVYMISFRAYSKPRRRNKRP